MFVWEGWWFFFGGCEFYCIFRACTRSIIYGLKCAENVPTHLLLEGLIVSECVLSNRQKRSK